MSDNDVMASGRLRLARLSRRYWPAGQRATTSAAVDSWLVALLIALAALALRGLGAGWLPSGYAVVPLVFAVALAAYAVGFRPALLTLVVAAVGLKFLFIGPRGTLYIPGFENRVIYAATCCGSILVAALFERMRWLMQNLQVQRELLRRLLDVQEREKQHLCNEFHDGLVQYAVGARMLLEGQRTDPDAPISPAVVDTVVDYLKRGIDDGRRAIRGIRPAILDDGELPEAIADLVDHFSSGGMVVEWTCDPQVGQLPQQLKTAVYRIVQEGLNNARRHSGTHSARVSVTAQDGDLLVEVADAGSGFDQRHAQARGFGLRGIAERARLVGGACLVESRPGQGTRIAIRIPAKPARQPRVRRRGSRPEVKAAGIPLKPR